MNTTFMDKKGMNIFVMSIFGSEVTSNAILQGLGRKIMENGDGFDTRAECRNVIHIYTVTMRRGL
jgi:hypothetical protein